MSSSEILDRNRSVVYSYWRVTNYNHVQNVAKYGLLNLVLYTQILVIHSGGN